MSSLSSRDLEEIRALGGVATECRTEEDLRDELLRRIQATLKAPSGLFFHYSSDGAPGQFHGGFSLGVPEQAPESWRKQWRRKDPFVRHFLRHVAAGGEPVCVSSSVVSPRDYVRSEFYCDFLAPQSVYHILVAGLFRARHMVGVLGLHRPQEASAFSATDMLKVNLILPHFTAAVTNVGMQEQLAARQSIIDTLAQDLACSAVLMLDANLEVVMANHRALDLLGLRADPPPGGHALPAEVRSGCLKAREQLQAAGAAAGTQMDLVLRIGGEAMRGFIRAQRSGVGALRYIVCFGPGARPLLVPERLARYALSPRETQIAELVSMGLTNVQVAGRLGISTRTVENHLRAIYRKVRVRNRTSLVAHLGHRH